MSAAMSDLDLGGADSNQWLFRSLVEAVAGPKLAQSQRTLFVFRNDLDDALLPRRLQEDADRAIAIAKKTLICLRAQIQSASRAEDGLPLWLEEAFVNVQRDLWQALASDKQWLGELKHAPLCSLKVELTDADRKLAKEVLRDLEGLPDLAGPKPCREMPTIGPAVHERTFMSRAEQPRPKSAKRVLSRRYSEPVIAYKYGAIGIAAVQQNPDQRAQAEELITGYQNAKRCQQGGHGEQ
jgi:hypothetical protein